MSEVVSHLDLDIPIFTKTYELYKFFYELLPILPKKDRYVLGSKCESVLLEILEGIIIATNLSKSEKLPILIKASTKLDVLKILFRLGKDLRIIERKKYLLLEASVQEIGKMLGGWIRSLAS